MTMDFDECGGSSGILSRPNDCHNVMHDITVLHLAWRWAKFPASTPCKPLKGRCTVHLQSLSRLIASFSEWIETEILERQSSNPAKVISVNATATGGCANHGPNAKQPSAVALGRGQLTSTTSVATPRTESI
jgi:hypothetical protein